MISLDRVAALVRKEFAANFRDPKLRVLLFLPPLLQLVIFGYAANMDVVNVRTALVDLDRTALSREFSARVAAADLFRIVARPETASDAVAEIDRGRATLALVIPRGFGAALAAGSPAPLQALHDGTDANSAQRVSGHLAVLSARFGREASRGGSARGIPPAVSVESRAWFNENLESRVFFVPGIVGTILLLVTLMLTSMAIVREKEIGTMEQLLVTPVAPLEIILGKTLPFLATGLAQAALIVTVALLWFEIPLRGSVPLLVAGLLVYLVSCLGLGILVSTVSSTQQQAMMLTSVVFMPSLLLSGFIFPIANMPRIVQAATLLVPLRYFLVIVRGIFLKGVGLAVLWPEFLALAALGAAILALAVSRFRRTID